MQYYVLNMPATSVIAKMSVSVLRRLKTCVSSAMKNDRLSSLGLMHIHRDFEVDLYTAMEVFVSGKTRRAWFLTILRYSCLSVIKIVLDSMLYETLKWPQIAPFCISSKILMACTLLSLIYAPENRPFNHFYNNNNHRNITFHMSRYIDDVFLLNNIPILTINHWEFHTVLI
jgi:hypothetical protein